MGLLTGIIEKREALLSPRVLSEKTASIVPLHMQVRALHMMVKLKEKIFGGREKVEFNETTIPDVSTLSLEEIDVSNPFLYKRNKWGSYFKRLRDESPVHFQNESPFGAFWSITRNEDIRFVDSRHDLFSSEPSIMIGDLPQELPVTSIIAMDPPVHDIKRKAVQGVVAPKNLKEMEVLIRSRTIEVLDSLPTDQPFDWAKLVSIELTSRMLATLFDFPYEKRHKLHEWSDIIGAPPMCTGGDSSEDKMFSVIEDIAKYFTALWQKKAARRAEGEELGFDLISLLLSCDDTKDMIKKPMEFMGNIGLLIVGGNDTTRNSMTGGVVAFNRFPEEFQKLKENPALIPSAVSEIVRWQTPLAHMRRVATHDVELRGKTIKKGDKVVMWYVSGNRDERAIENPDQLIIDRKNVRNHLAFGLGVHRCMGNRLAELQLKILWEELLKRFEDIRVIEEPKYVQSNFVNGYTELMVRLTEKT